MWPTESDFLDVGSTVLYIIFIKGNDDDIDSYIAGKIPKKVNC